MSGGKIEIKSLKLSGKALLINIKLFFIPPKYETSKTIHTEIENEKIVIPQ